MKIFDIINKFKEVSEIEKIDKKSCGRYWILAKASEISYLRNVLNLDEESIAECIDSRQASRISFFSDYIFLVCNVLSNVDGIIRSKEMNIFLSDNYILTVFKDDINLLDEFINDIYEDKNCFMLITNPKPSMVLYYILDRLIVRNYDVISRLEAKADKIEINILKDPKHEQIDQLIHLRRQVYKTRKYLNPLRYIGDSLVVNENSIIEEENIEHFVILNNKIDKLMLALESLVQDLALVREAFESEIANKTNELMKIFTLIATIFLPLNLLTSMYGMNFQCIPLVECENGYYYMLGFMLFISIGLIVLFKLKKWL